MHKVQGVVGPLERALRRKLSGWNIQRWWHVRGMQRKLRAMRDGHAMQSMRVWFLPFGGHCRAVKWHIRENKFTVWRLLLRMPFKLRLLLEPGSGVDEVFRGDAFRVSVMVTLWRRACQSNCPSVCFANIFQTILPLQVCDLGNS